MKYIKNCPICNKELTYSSSTILKKSIKNNCKCSDCYHKSQETIRPNGLTRNCPLCNKKLSYKSKKSYDEANITNGKCHKCAVNTSGRIYSKGNKHLGWKGTKYIPQGYFTDLKVNAGLRNKEFNLTIDYLDDLFKMQNGQCALTGMDIFLSARGKKTASLDRIDNTKGYIESNVHWVHKDINMMKHVHSQDYFINLCNKVTNYNLNNNITTPIDIYISNNSIGKTNNETYV